MHSLTTRAPFDARIRHSSPPQTARHSSRVRTGPGHLAMVGNRQRCGNVGFSGSKRSVYGDLVEIHGFEAEKTRGLGPFSGLPPNARETVAPRLPDRRTRELLHRRSPRDAIRREAEPVASTRFRLRPPAAARCRLGCPRSPTRLPTRQVHHRGGPRSAGANRSVCVRSLAGR